MMQKTIFMTGSTDGIGLEAAKLLCSLGHRVLLHGRSEAKLERAKEEIAASGGRVDGVLADLSDLAAVEALAEQAMDKLGSLDVLVNNAGVFAVPNPMVAHGLDVRFVVNTIAPYALVQELLPRLESAGRIINLSSAAQSPVDLAALRGEVRLSDGPAYAQSKLALTMWSRSLGLRIGDAGPAVIAVNPGSMLGTKMVQDAYGVAGGDVGIGAEILRRAALDEDFAGASGQYFDNDAGRFASPHPDALDAQKCADVVEAVETVLARAIG